MRKGFDALCGEVRRGMGRDPVSGEVFIFYNSSRTRLKLLHWGRGGFVIYHKHLERGILTLPRVEAREGGCRVTWRELVLMVEGVELERDNLAGVVEKMRDELRQLCRMLFGRKSERFIPSDPAQLKLDFEGVAELNEEREYAALQASAPTARKKPAPRIKRPPEERQRRIFEDHLERRDEIIEPDEIPSQSKHIGEEITELLEYKPGELYIRRLICLKVAMPDGEGVVIGELPSLPLPKSNAGPSLLAQLLTGKYQDHLPLHRQIGIFARAGVQLKASTVSDWVQGVAELLEPLYECLRKRVLSCDYIQIDETTIPVLDKDKPGSTRKGYHWVVCSPELKTLFSHYDKGSRAQYVAVELLKDFQDAVQSDGCGAYDIYENKHGVLLLGCWAHIRRKFEHALTDDPRRAE